MEFCKAGGCFKPLYTCGDERGLEWGHTGDFMLEVPEEPFLQGDIRLRDNLIIGGEPANLLDFRLRHGG